MKKKPEPAKNGLALQYCSGTVPYSFSFTNLIFNAKTHQHSSGPAPDLMKKVRLQNWIWPVDTDTDPRIWKIYTNPRIWQIYSDPQIRTRICHIAQSYPFDPMWGRFEPALVSFASSHIPVRVQYVLSATLQKHNKYR